MFKIQNDQINVIRNVKKKKKELPKKSYSAEEIKKVRERQRRRQRKKAIKNNKPVNYFVILKKGSKKSFVHINYASTMFYMDHFVKNKKLKNYQT